MLLGCGCLLAMLAAFAPRVVLLFMWIMGPRVNAAFDTWIMPLLGLILMHYTTIMYFLVWSPWIGVVGWDWVWIGLGVMLDIMKWGQIANKRKQIPGYPQEYGASQRPGSDPEAELEKLADGSMDLG